MEKPDVDLIEGPVAGDLDRAEGDQPQPALHRRHGDRDPRLPAPALRARRHAVLPRARAAAGGAERVADGRSRARAARGQPLHDPRAGGGRTQGRAGRTVRGAARAGLRARCASTARSTRSTRCRSWRRTTSTRSTSWSTASRCTPTCGSAWPNRSRPRCATPTGRAIAVEMDTGKEHLFSAKFACPVCSYSLPELEPRLFSFNNPMGACPKCDGLGSIQFFDPKRVVASPTCRSRPARSAAGTGATSSTSRCCRASPRTTASTSSSRSRHSPEIAQTSCSTARARRKIAFRYLTERGRTDDARARLRGHHPQPRAPLPRDRLGGGARGTRQVPQHQALPRLRGHAPAPRGAPRADRRQGAAQRQRPAAAATRSHFFDSLQLAGPQAAGRREDRQGDRVAPIAS